MAFLLVARPVQAAYQYIFDQTNYAANISGTVAVNVYLQETETTVLQQGVGAGLAGAGVKVVFCDPPLPSSPAKVLSSSAIVNTSHFPAVWSKGVSDGVHGSLLLGAGFDPDTDEPVDVYGGETFAGSGIYRALLGTFTFTAGAVASQVTYIRATDYAATSDTITGDLMALDDLIADGMATITTVPEPSALRMLGVIALALFVSSVGRSFAKERDEEPGTLITSPHA